MSELFQLETTFDTATRKKDKSLSFRFTTNKEISTEEYMKIDQLVQQSGWLVFSPNEVQASEVPEMPADEAYGKMSDSQYQRWLLKKTFEHIATDLTWAEWYHQQESVINGRLLERLQELER